MDFLQVHHFDNSLVDQFEYETRKTKQPVHQSSQFFLFLHIQFTSFGIKQGNHCSLNYRKCAGEQGTKHVSVIKEGFGAERDNSLPK